MSESLLAYSKEGNMKTLAAVYKGDRFIELAQDIELPKDYQVIVLIPEQEDEEELRQQFQTATEAAFARLWDNEEDEIWRDYL
jgi:hypothetical protein